MRLADLLFRISHALRRLFQAKGIGSFHSPFLYELGKEALFRKTSPEDIRLAVNYHNELISAEDVIFKKELNPLLAKGEGAQKLLSDEVQRAGLTPKKAAFLFRLIKFLEPKTLIELGTNAGVSTFYQALALQDAPGVHFYTIEGNADLHEKAGLYYQLRRQFYTKLPEVRFLQGMFKDVLPPLLDDLDSLDFLFLDGDHRGEAVINYVDQCARKASGKACFVLDDIFWSKDMYDAWKELENHPKVTLSIELNDLGLLFFDPRLSKEKVVSYFR